MPPPPPSFPPAAQPDPATVRRRSARPPAPIEAFDIPHPDLPERLDGLRVLHISDVHIRRARRRTGRWDRILSALESTPADLACFTGDYVDQQGQEAGALIGLADMLAACRTRLGCFGSFGNHDTPAMRRAARALPGIRWLSPAPTEPLADPDGGEPLPLRLIGLDWPEDPVSAVLSMSDADAFALRAGGLLADGAFPLTLVHMPTALLPCAEVNLPFMLAGHTHGGQIRLHARLAPHTSSDIPPHLATGCLRLGRSLCCVSRGVGESWVPGLRINCPRQIPLYTLRRGPLPPEPAGGSPQTVNQVLAW
ncbi:MAG: metallophosphoesterase [Phycisphaeraceae bacterium]|nr:metallophosphoesterase [Phycisphaeraceae bacterium]